MLMTKHVTMIAKHIKAEEKNVLQRIQATVYRHSPLLPYYYCYGQRGKEKTNKKKWLPMGQPRCLWGHHRLGTEGWQRGAKSGNFRPSPSGV